LKSQEEAIVGLYEIFADGENVSEVYCSATKTKQAKVVWNEAKLMRFNSSLGILKQYLGTMSRKSTN